MVTWLLGTERIGNMVRFADNSGYMVITPACASFANISLRIPVLGHRYAVGKPPLVPL